VLSPAQILDRISDRLDLFKGRRDSEARQETLRATIEWSYELLDDEQRRLFGRLAIFRGGCTLEAAEAVVDADLDTLQSLVDKSLVRHSDERFWMLETIRAYAHEQLAARGDDADLRRRHALFALDFAAQVDEEAQEGGQQARLFPLMEREQDNIRAALEWARDSGADEILLRLAAALASFWPGRGYYHEADMWFALALERGFSPVRARMKVLRAASIRAAGTRDYVRSDGYIHEWKELAEQAGDENELLLAMNSAALNASECGEVDRARTEFAAIRERAREIGDANLIAFATINLGAVAYQRGDARAAREYANAAIGLFRDLGDDGGIASAQGTSGWSSLALSDAASAEAAFREALRLAAKLGWKRGVAMNAAGLGAALVSRHQEGRAVQLFGAAASIFVELGAGFDNEHEDRVQEEAITQARAALGKKAFTDAWDRGKAMTPEDAVRIALHEVPA
jgi:hypothetical protein